MSGPRLSVWPPLSFWTYAREPVRQLPFPLDEPAHRLFSRARHALFAGLPAIGLRAGDIVLVPAYHHGSEIEALIRAGLSPAYYDVGPDLAPSEAELERLLEPRVRALYITHYLGFPQDIDRWRTWCDARGLLLVEDAAQSWLATIDDVPVGSFGDLSIFCLYKTFGLPDGAALHTRPCTAPGSHPAHGGYPTLARRHAAWLMSRSEGCTRLAERIRSEGSYSAADDFDLGDANRSASNATRRILAHVVDVDAAARRRANYATFAALLDGVSPLFAALPAGASPFAFPVITPDKARLLHTLDRVGVAALDVWSVPHPSLPARDHPNAARLRASVVGLPVHQELTANDLDRIATSASTPRPCARDRWRIEPIEDLEDVRPELDELAAASGNLFWTADWLTLWRRHLGDGHRLAAFSCRDARGDVVGVLPLHYARGLPLRVLRFLGHTVSDELGPIARPEDRPAAIRALRSALDQLDFDVFLAEHLPADARWQAGLGGQQLRTTASPVLHFGNRTWAEVTGLWSANFRQQIGRKKRKLCREHEVEFRLTTDVASLDRDLDTLFTLHAARWNDETSFGGSTEPFHREFVHRALERGWLRLWTLEVEGRAVASWYGFRFEGAELYYQTGRDPEWSSASVGLVLLTHTMREALRDGATKYRFLEGSEPYKFRMANDGSSLDTLAVARGPLGVTAVAAALVLGHQRVLTRVGHRIMR